MRIAATGPVLVSQQGATATITLNRPEKRNAVSNTMLLTMVEALQDAALDDDVRSVVLTSRGDYFSAGRDIRERDEETDAVDPSKAPITHEPGPFLRALTLLLECPKPTIAAVRGFALGGGQALTLACDFLVAERGARFGNVEMAYGFPAAMNIALLTRHLGRRLGLEIAMTGELYSAERYWEMGLVNRLAEAGELDATVREFVELLNSREPWAVQRTKSAFRMAAASTDSAAMYIGDELNQLLFGRGGGGVHSGSEDVRQTIKSNIEPRGI
jgi:enoyl-CoA hydratase/carnithine racemase